MTANPDAVAGLRIRLERAEKHLSELAREVDRVNADPHTHRIRKERDAKRPVYRWRMEVRQPPPPELALIIADCVNHMRSVLDNIMWELAYKFGNARIRRIRRAVRFPICVTEDSWRALKPVLSYLPAEVVGGIEAHQPYRVRDCGLSAQEHFVWILNRRWNADKHRRIEPLRFIVVDARFGPDTVLERSAVKAAFAPRADHGAIIGFVRCRKTLSPDDEASLYANFLFDIGFGPRAMDAHPVVRTLHHFHKVLSESTLPLFEPFLIQ